MKGGGKIEDDRWTARVKALREGDCIQAQNWSSGEDGFWYGGPAMQVLLVAPTGLRDGFYDVYTLEVDGTTERQFCIRADDQVSLASREAKVEKIYEPKAKRPPKPKKGDQLKLF